MLAMRFTANHQVIGSVLRCGAASLWLGALLMPSVAGADVAFQYEPLTDPIVSASFSMDVAALSAHRTLGEYELNFVQLVDCRTGGGLGDWDLSDDLFGTASYPDSPQLDQGTLETGIYSASIDAAFYPVLAGGQVGLRALLTDTVDAMFALDFLSLTIETSSGGIVESLYGWPVAGANDGYGIGLVDGQDLPAPLPESIPVDSTGTGFDETISSLSILAIPEPATLPLVVFGIAIALRRRTPGRG